ncbi:hypothetical protein AAE478_009514 [Parahypoxylon ruwenzoriense]
MCIQIYHSFKICPCQLRSEFRPCVHGPASPKCPRVRDLVQQTRFDYCGWHRLANAAAVSNPRLSSAFFASRGRCLWPPTPDTPCLGRGVGANHLLVASVADYVRFPRESNTDLLVDACTYPDTDGDGPFDEKPWCHDETDRDELLATRKAYYARTWA